MLKLVLLLGAGCALAEQPATFWVPYSARYVEIADQSDKAGHRFRHTEASLEEIRSADGSLLTTTLMGGERVTGTLWQGCGQRIDLNYARKEALFGAMVPRQHPYPPPDSPVGSITIEDVQFTGYPIHTDDGRGTVWVNLDDDIVGRVELHIDMGAGIHLDQIRQLTSLDLSSAIDESLLQVPASFTQNVSRGSRGCTDGAIQ